MGIKECVGDDDIFRWSAHHRNGDLFDKSQWEKPDGPVSLAYVIWRVCLAVFFLCNVILDIHDTVIRSKWIIFMTSQGIALLTIYYIYDALLVVIRYVYEIRNPDKKFHRSPMGVPWQVLWIYQTAIFDVALFITVVFWAALYGGTHFATTRAAYLNFFVHGLNTISVVIDTFIIAKPIRVPHVFYAFFYGIGYMVFSLIYWAAGGLGPCSPCPENCESVPCVEKGYCVTRAVHQDDGQMYLEYCPEYIYPITDWGNRPKSSVITVCCGLVGIFIIHFVFLGFVALRRYIYRRTVGKSNSVGEQRNIEVVEVYKTSSESFN